MDVHVPRAITAGLRRRGVDVLTAQENGSDEFEDEELLVDRALQLERVLYTRDADFLSIVARRQTEGVAFCGVVYSHQLDGPGIGQCVLDLETLAKAGEPGDVRNKLLRLPYF